MAAPTTLAEALVAFQKNAPHVPLDGTNPHFNSKHATLPGALEAVREPLAAVGCAVLQFPCTLDSGMPGLRTILIHTSGERIEDVMPLAVEKPGPQAQGSALTYARRYAVLAVLGLAGDSDDDANAAEKPKAVSKPAAAGGADSSEEGLTASLLAAADTLGLRDATVEAVEKSKEARSAADHLAWLRAQLAAAVAAVTKAEA